MSKRLLVFILILLVVAAGITGAVLALTGSLSSLFFPSAALKTANAFMTAVKTSDHGTGYDLCSQAFQKDLGAPQKLQDMLDEGGIELVLWTFDSKEVKGDQAVLTGTVTLSHGRLGTVNLVLIYEKDKWKVAGFNIQEN